jgi:signal transduction histidine kinase
VTHSLNFRLLAAFTVIIVVIIGTVFFFTYHNTRNEISRIEQRLETAQDRRVEVEVARYYQLAGTWDGVQPAIMQLAKLYNARVILTDNTGIVQADSDGKLTGTKYSTKGQGQPVTTIEGGFGNPFRPNQNVSSSNPAAMPVTGASTTGVLYVIHNDSQDIDRTSLQITYNTIGRFFLWGGLVAIAVAFLLTYVLSRRVLAPVKALTSVTREFGKGDFTRRVEVNDKGEMGELARSFNTMADGLERNERLRRNMVADIAHELRTPLSNLRGYLEAISDGLVKPDETTIHSLSDEATSLARLVEDLQELSLADAGELKLVMQPEQVSRLIKETITALQPKTTSKGIVVFSEVPDTLPVLDIDSQRIKQVLYNLVDNAVAHTGQGGRITVTAWREEGQVYISVADTGEGIPAEDLPFIFERFYRVDKSRTRATGGTGLGLTIARRIVEAHGGRIDVRSKVGEGTTFTFSLPTSKNEQREITS